MEKATLVKLRQHEVVWFCLREGRRGVGAGMRWGDRTREKVSNGDVRTEPQEMYVWWDRVTKLS